MPTLEETFTWAAYGDSLKSELGISGTDQDNTLQRELTLAAKAGDDWIGCRWPTGTSIPAADVAVLFGGIVSYITTARTTRGYIPGLTNRRQGDFSEAYGFTSGVDPVAAPLKAAAEWWRPYRKGENFLFG